MEFVKWFVNKYGIMIGGGSLIILFLFFVFLSVFTKGAILIFIPLLIFIFVVSELFDFYTRKR